MRHWTETASIKQILLDDRPLEVLVACSPYERTMGLLQLNSFEGAVLFQFDHEAMYPFTSEGMQFDFHINFYDGAGVLVDSMFVDKPGVVWPSRAFRYVIESSSPLPIGNLNV